MKKGCKTRPSVTYPPCSGLWSDLQKFLIKNARANQFYYFFYFYFLLSNSGKSPNPTNDISSDADDLGEFNWIMLQLHSCSNEHQLNTN